MGNMGELIKVDFQTGHYAVDPASLAISEPTISEAETAALSREELMQVATRAEARFAGLAKTHQGRRRGISVEFINATRQKTAIYAYLRTNEPDLLLSVESYFGVGYSCPSEYAEFD